MGRIFGIPDHSPGELHFKLFGFPVRVHPFFWIYSVLMVSNRETGQVVIWTGVIFLSILIHELGHGVAMRMFGEKAELLLYAWGGLAIPVYGRYLKPAAQILVCVAGPVAGFVLAGLVGQVAVWAGAKLSYSMSYLILPRMHAVFEPSGPGASMYAFLYKSTLFNDLLWVNLTWGAVNLFPIYPLDGGQAMRYLLGPGRLRLSLLISAVAAVLVALAGLFMQSIYVVFFFGVLAAGSAQAIEALPKRPFGPSRMR